MEISLLQLEESCNRYDSTKYKNTRSEIEEIGIKEDLFAMEDSIAPALVKGNIIGNEENLIKRKEMITASGHEPVDFAFERAIGKNDSVYSNFIDLIIEAKKKVGRIVIKNGSDIEGYATGFMVSESLMLTNWHVFKTESDVKSSSIQFNYELDTHGNPSKSISFDFSPSTFFYSFKELDYCIVSVQPHDNSGKYNLSDIGYIYLDPTLGKLGNEDEELLNIIHHPS